MKHRIAVFACLLSIAVSGCGHTWEENTEDDQERAREVLLTALDQWKAGQVSSLATRTPPIRFSDDDYMSGLRLADYELQKPDEAIHPFRDVAVQLTVLDSQGQSRKKLVTYQVGLEPVVTVQRSDN